MERFEDKFDYPPNPALTNQTIKLKKFESFCQEKGLHVTKLQEVTTNRDKRKIEYDFWRRGIKQTLKGYRD